MQMQFTTVASSEGRLWRGLEANVYDISAGVADRAPTANYAMSLHLSGAVEGTCRCDGRLVRRTIQSGDIDFITLGSAATWNDAGPGRVASIRLSPALMRANVPSQLSVKDPVLRHLLLAVVCELESGRDDAMFAEDLGAAIATHLQREHSRVRTPTRSNGRSRRQLARVLDYVDTNLTANLSYHDVAAVAGITTSQLKALFKHSLGVPVRQYVIRRRVEYAARLLARADARLCDVAQQAGFSDQSHLTKCMRRVMGTTPATLLRELQR